MGQTSAEHFAAAAANLSIGLVLPGILSQFTILPGERKQK